MRKLLLPLLLALLLLLSPAFPAHADSGSVVRIGETVRPIRDTQVEMVAEEVRVCVTWERACIEATFTFRNTGPATTVLMGFPEYEQREEGIIDEDVVLRDFRAWVDGVEAAVRREPGLVPDVTRPADSSSREMDFPAWHTWEVDFLPGQTREVRNTYWCGHSDWPDLAVHPGYILVTGSTWHGNIGRARITFEFEDILPHELIRISPGGYRFEGTSLVWEWTDFEPAENIYVTVERPIILPWAFPYLREDADALEKLHRQGNHADLLARVRALQASATPQQVPTLLLYEARACQGLGRTAEAGAAWERLLELAPMAVGAAWEYGPAAEARVEALYHLAGNAHAAGDWARMEEIYRQLRDSRVSLAVQRWVESLLPAGSIDRSAPLVAVELQLDPRYGWQLCVCAEDPDGDMVSLKATAWLVADGSRDVVVDKWMAVGQDRYSAGKQYQVGAIPPGSRIEYRVEVGDVGGLVTVVTTPDEAPQAVFDPLQVEQVEVPLVQQAGDQPVTRPWLWGSAAAALLILGTAAWLLRRKKAA